MVLERDLKNKMCSNPKHSDDIFSLSIKINIWVVNIKLNGTCEYNSVSRVISISYIGVNMEINAKNILGVNYYIGVWLCNLLLNRYPTFTIFQISHFFVKYFSIWSLGENLFH
jgi:hypothetical protein